MSAGRSKVAVIAVGGNALIADPKHRSIADQAEAAVTTSRHIADVIESGWRVVLTHGNGPQVGFVLRRSEIAMSELPPVPMDYATADTQGAIGFMFQRALRNELHRRDIAQPVITVITQVLVERDDAAFERPSKPIGSHFDAALARRLAEREGWVVKEDAGRGWRRVVASPLPRAIIELDAIKQLVRDGYVVIACGGGGIPVVEDEDGCLQGVEAVIDKDYVSSLLARGIGADALVISTGVEKVALNFGTPDAVCLDRLTLAEAERYLAEHHFAEGSMAPKVEAVIEYLATRGDFGAITDTGNISRALDGAAGTRFVRDG